MFAVRSLLVDCLPSFSRASAYDMSFGDVYYDRYRQGGYRQKANIELLFGWGMRAILCGVWNTLCGHIMFGTGRDRGHHPKAVFSRVTAGLRVYLYVSNFYSRLQMPGTESSRETLLCLHMAAVECDNTTETTHLYMCCLTMCYHIVPPVRLA